MSDFKIAKCVALSRLQDSANKTSKFLPSSRTPIRGVKHMVDFLTVTQPTVQQTSFLYEILVIKIVSRSCFLQILRAQKISELLYPVGTAEKYGNCYSIKSNHNRLKTEHLLSNG